MVIDLNEKAASNLSIGRLGPTKMDLLPADIRPLSEIEAYEIQDCLHQKIQRTSPQKQLAF